MSVGCTSRRPGCDIAPISRRLSCKLSGQKGCGTTSSAVSVAAAFAEAGYSACLLDTDPQFNTADTLDSVQANQCTNDEFFTASQRLDHELTLICRSTPAPT